MPENLSEFLTRELILKAMALKGSKKAAAAYIGVAAPTLLRYIRRMKLTFPDPRYKVRRKEIQEMKKLRKKGMPLKDIAQKYGVSVTTVSCHCRSVYYR